MICNSVNYSFRHSPIALLTKHKKEREIVPLLKNFLGTTIELFNSFDTDELGTFTREKKRINTQLETARFKAHKAIELSGFEIGIGSEGSFSSDPYMGMIPWNTEMIVLVDKKNDLEIVGIEQRPFKSIQKKICSITELENLLADFDFPNNNIVIRPNDENDLDIRKDFQSKNELFEVCRELIRISLDGYVFVENDHRAHRSVARMEAIRYATIDLLMKCHSFCPECNAPGFWVNRGEGGLPCSYCGKISDTFQYIVYKCNKCLFEERRTRGDIHHVDPQYCNRCNP